MKQNARHHSTEAAAAKEFTTKTRCNLFHERPFERFTRRAMGSVIARMLHETARVRASSKVRFGEVRPTAGDARFRKELQGFEIEFLLHPSPMLRFGKEKGTGVFSRMYDWVRLAGRRTPSCVDRTSPVPRQKRADEAGAIYHALNRGNARQAIFHKSEDYEAFLRVLGEGLARYAVELFSFTLMPNHWHLVLRPAEEGQMGRLLRWVTATHTQRYHAHYHTAGEGHLYQARFKSFPVADDDHFLIVCRYVERNPLRAGLVLRAEAWRYGSLWRWLRAEVALTVADLSHTSLDRASPSAAQRQGTRSRANVCPTRASIR